jgi:hypothetical protein
MKRYSEAELRMKRAECRPDQCTNCAACWVKIGVKGILSKGVCAACGGKCWSAIAERPAQREAA